MSLHNTAQHLASKGRGPDTLLIHMTPGEVGGLQALAQAHGTSLTVNPDTGLPEAGILSSLLPTLIGAGITAATGGAAAPWMVGAGMGGLEALRTGSLNKGLMAGLGGFGGAGLTGSLMGLGTGALSQQAGAAASQGLEGVAADRAAEQAIKERLASASFVDKLKAGVGTFDWNKPMDFVSSLGGGSKGKGFGLLGAAAAPGVMAALEPQQYAPQQMASDSRRAPGLVYRGGNVYGRMTPEQEASRNMKYGFAEGGLAAGGMPEWNKAWNPDVPQYGDQGRDFGREILYYNPEETTPVPPLASIAQPSADTGVSAGYGGAGGQDFGGMQTSTPDWDTTNTIGNMMSNYGLPSIGDYLQQAAKEGQADARMDVNTQTGAYSQDAQNQRAAEAAAMAGGDVGGGPAVGGVSDFGEAAGAGDAYAMGGLTALASGGLGSLGSYSDGGRLLRGPGDGVSDSIPATIGRSRQPARLADGEFVFPARIVSEIGNGSTAAGARKLYAMMDRIQKNRGKTVGKGKVAVDSKSHKLLLA